MGITASGKGGRIHKNTMQKAREAEVLTVTASRDRDTAYVFGGIEIPDV